MYDPTTETTVSGIVEEVQNVSGTRGWHGIHLQLKTADEVLDVHIGPSWFLAQKKFEISKGDQVEVTGSKLRLDNVDTLIARTIKKGDSQLTLRNEQGIPAWSRGRRF
ncbi:MAG: DNA-binding protein [Terriglobia bacterium]|nr:DNA-binding protein [Terriglobia bacterium]